MQKGYQNGY